jgi:hypothetical protein
VRRAFFFVALLLGVVGCVHTDRQEVFVSIADAPTQGRSTPAPRCTIRGEGGWDPEWATVPFDLYPNLGATTPALRVVRTAEVRATWSDLPSELVGGRARIDIDDPELRARAYASLAGRGFQLRHRAYQVPEHVWIEGAVPIELLGTEGDRLVVRRWSGLARPPFFRALVPCGELVYEPEALEVPGAPELATTDDVKARAVLLHLAQEPSVPPFLAVDVGADAPTFGVVARSAGHVRLSFAGNGVGFDAWVPESEVETVVVRPRGLHGEFTGRGLTSSVRRVRVTEDAAIFVGRAHRKLDDATFRRGATLTVGDEDGDFVAVELDDGRITAPEGMWIAKAAVR